MGITVRMGEHSKERVYESKFADKRKFLAQFHIDPNDAWPSPTQKGNSLAKQITSELGPCVKPERGR
jgi:hypothetical protein